MSFRIENGHINPRQNTQKTQNARNQQRLNNQIDNSFRFQKIFDEKIQEQSRFKISAHAEKRMEERNIRLDEADVDALKNAMDSLAEKGAQESLMIYKDMAFIASIRNRTIITTMNNDELDIVTNIDSLIKIK